MRALEPSVPLGSAGKEAAGEMLLAVRADDVLRVAGGVVHLVQGTERFGHAVAGSVVERGQGSVVLDLLQILMSLSVA